MISLAYKSFDNGRLLPNLKKMVTTSTIPTVQYGVEDGGVAVRDSTG